MRWYLKAVKQWDDFKGRARRKEYWFFMLFYALLAMVCGFVDVVLGTWNDAKGYGPILALFNFAMLLPLLAVSIRRLHDTGRSGWWYLVWFIPAIGPFVFLGFMFLDSKPGENEYGPNPKRVTAAV
jgi:uncharacterized membrane protein YhaH (DUF805 family)